MSTRTRYFVSWFGFRWHFRAQGRRTLATFKRKEDAVAYARSALATSWQRERHLSELAIRDRLGVIREKETYGKDPGRHKG